MYRKPRAKSRKCPRQRRAAFAVVVTIREGLAFPSRIRRDRRFGAPRMFEPPDDLEKCREFQEVCSITV